jgi:hypothetical protein
VPLRKSTALLVVLCIGWPQTCEADRVLVAIVGARFRSDPCGSSRSGRSVSLTGEGQLCGGVPSRWMPPCAASARPARCLELAIVDQHCPLDTDNFCRVLAPSAVFALDRWCIACSGCHMVLPVPAGKRQRRSAFVFGPRRRCGRHQALDNFREFLDHRL